MFLIVCGGDPPSQHDLAELAGISAVVIAADRGLDYCLEAGIIPDVAVGDMDSVSEESLEKASDAGVEIIRFSTRKDWTDTELALDEAVKRGAAELTLTAATGDRFDHVLANIHLLKKALDLGITARIVSGSQQVILVDSERSIDGMKGYTLSILPLTDEVTGIELTGVEYPLHDAQLRKGMTLGISNVINTDHATISVFDGILVAVLSSHV